MKHLFKSVIFIFIGLVLASCSEDVDNEPPKPPKDTFAKNINKERFTKLEIGNLDLEALQSASNMHVNFTFVGGKSNFKKITLDIDPVKVGTPKKGEKVWKVKDYEIDKKKYEGQKNPKLHYHLHYTKKGETHKIAPGTYRIRIVVDHEDKTQSAITTNFNVIKKFEGFKVGENDSRKVKLGAKKINFEYKILIDTKNIESVEHRLYFREWRQSEVGKKRPDGREIVLGKFNYTVHPLAKEKYLGKKDPTIQEHIALNPDFKGGKYYVGIALKEKGKKEVRLYKSFEILDSFINNTNKERFTKLEIGNLDLETLQSAGDMHVNFTFVGGKSNFKKITLNIEPVSVGTPKQGERVWKLKDYVINEKKYKGQKNPKLHYHLDYNQKGEKGNIAPGIYRIRIVVDHEDGTQSAVTTNFTVIKKFEGYKLGENDSGKVKLGAKKVYLEYKILADGKNIESIKYNLWFKEWRENQTKPDGKPVKVGEWNVAEYTVYKELYQGKINPLIKHHIALDPGLKEGTWWLGIYLKEKGKKKDLSLYRPLKVVK